MLWLRLQSFTKKLRLTLLFMRNSGKVDYGKLQEKFKEFQEFFASINKIFISAGRLGARLLFYEV